MFERLLSDLKTFIILTLVSLLVILLDNVSLLRVPKSALQTVTTPIQYGLYKTSQSVGKQLEFIVLSRRASQENKALTEQLSTVLSENANLRRKLAETQGFLDQQHSLNPVTYNLVATRPIALSRYLRIDKGSDSGIASGMSVVYKDTFLGIVKDVSPKSSQVLLSSDPDSKIAAFDQNKDGKSKGILLGQFGSDMLLDKILHEEPISVGDLVYSEGTEGTLPRGLILGQVSSVDERPNEVFKQARVKNVFQVSDLDIVFVITN